MMGAIIGDIAGSRFEGLSHHKSKDFELFNEHCEFTDDTVLTSAIAGAVLDCKGDYKNLGKNAVLRMHLFGRLYEGRGFGGGFCDWLYSKNKEPYKSCGNGAAMRVSPVAWAAKTLAETKKLSRAVTAITHNHPEGIKGAEAVAVCVFLARKGYKKTQISKHVKKNYYDLDFTIDEIREDYIFDATCQNSVPQAIEAFLESTSFEDAIRNAISIGGDSDTIAAIAGSIAEAYYGIPQNIRETAFSYIDDGLLGDIVLKFEKIFKPKIIPQIMKI
jgi:type I restriction enzyme M protein